MINTCKNNLSLKFNSSNTLIKAPKLISYFINNDLVKFFNLSNYKENLPKFFYIYDDFLNNIFYDFNEVINTDSNIKKGELCYYFYLSLLIKDNKKLDNHLFSIDYINDINNFYKNNNKILKTILTSKIFLELINNFEESEKNKEEINKIKKEILNKIEENINYLQEFKSIFEIKNIQNQNIELIYIEIIIELIKLNKFKDLEYIHNIINELDLKNINITKTMFDALYKTLEKIDNYLISNKEDLFNENKINFYYILLKYILKKSFYIYQFPLLLKTRKIILNILESGELLFENINIDIKKKLEYIIKKFSDSDYYFSQKLSDSIILKLKEILTYYRNFLFESKKEEINIIENIIKNKKGNYKKYYKDYDIATKMNNIFPFIEYLIYKEKIEINKITENDIKKIVNLWENIEKMILEKKLKEIGEDLKQNLKIYFCENNNKEKLLNIFNIDNYNYVINFFNENEKKKYDEKKNKDKNEENNDNKNKITTTNKKKLFLNNIEESKINIVNKKSLQNKKKIQRNLIERKIILDSTHFIIIYETNLYINSIKKGDTKLENESSSLELIENLELAQKMILNNSYILIHLDKRGHYPLFEIDDIYYGKSFTKINIDKFKISLAYFRENNENILISNYLKFRDFFKEFEQRLSNDFKYNYNLRIKLKFEYENEINNNIYSIICFYTFYDPITNESKEYRDENILINHINSISGGYLYMISDINDETFKDIEYQDFNTRNKKTNKQNKKEVDEIPKIEIIENNFDDNQNSLNNTNKINKISGIDEKDEEKKILSLKVNKKKMKSFNGYIKDLNNGYYITKKDSNIIVINDINFNPLMEIKYNDFIINISQRNQYNERGKKRSQILVYGKKEVYLTNLYLSELTHKTKKYCKLSISYLNLIDMEDKNYILTSDIGLYHVIVDLSNTNSSQPLIKEIYLNGIRITKNIVVLSPNKQVNGGKDEIMFYDIIEKKTICKIEGYSFYLNKNALTLMKNGILLCSCKKHCNEQKNGILLINIQFFYIKGDKIPLYKFYYTENFSPFLLCPIMKVENNNKNDDNIYNIDNDYIKNIIRKETNYFFSVGIDWEKNEEKIKLYKINYVNNELNNPEIKYIKNIEFNNNESKEKFKKIDKIIQSRIDGRVILGSADGSIYFLEP